MLQDDKSFVPGTARKIAVFTLTPEDLMGDFWQPQDCPFFRALKRVGVPVKAMGSFGAPFWSDENDQLHRVSDEIREALKVLPNTNRRRSLRAKRFAGKSYSVSWEVEHAG